MRTLNPAKDKVGRSMAIMLALQLHRVLDEIILWRY